MDMFTTITDDALVRVIGAMNVDNLPESTNIEDRRGDTWLDHLRRRLFPPPLPPPLPPPTNDQMARELGIDDIKIPPRKR